LLGYNQFMSKLDKAKEYINMLKVYMGILIALLISDISGTVKLAKYAHKKIDELEEL